MSQRRYRKHIVTGLEIPVWGAAPSEIKTQATHVDASGIGLADGGSTPPTSTTICDWIVCWVVRTKRIAVAYDLIIMGPYDHGIKRTWLE